MELEQVHYETREVVDLFLLKKYRLYHVFPLNILGIAKLEKSPDIQRWENSNGNIYIQREAWAIQIETHSSNVYIFANDLISIDVISKEYSFLIEEDGNSSIFAFEPAEYGIEVKKVFQHNVNHALYKELYPDIDIDILIEDYLSSRENILILLGDPGVGKTMFSRFLLTKIEGKRIAICRNEGLLRGSSFWNRLQEQKIDVLVLDDVDFSLEKDPESVHLLSNILAFTDGIIINKTKVIITTNNSIKDINEALIRPGRCFDYLTLSKLEFSQAFSLWKSVLCMTEDSFKEFFKEEKYISQAQLMNAYNHVQSAKQPRRYLRNKDAKNSFAGKKLGF